MLLALDLGQELIYILSISILQEAVFKGQGLINPVEKRKGKPDD